MPPSCYIEAWTWPARYSLPQSATRKTLIQVEWSAAATCPVYNLRRTFGCKAGRCARRGAAADERSCTRETSAKF